MAYSCSGADAEIQSPGLPISGAGGVQCAVLEQSGRKFDLVGLGPFESRHHHHVRAGELITHQEIGARQRALDDSDLLMESFYCRSECRRLLRCSDELGLRVYAARRGSGHPAP